MSCSGILPDFSICSGVEELLYLSRGPPWSPTAPAARHAGRPGRCLTRPSRGPPEPPSGSSAAASWEELRPPAFDASPIPPRAIVRDGLGEEGEEKKAGEEKMRGEESDGR